MNWKKVGKVSLYVLLGLVLIIGTIAGYFYYQFQGKYPANEEKYPHYIGYLSPTNQDFSRNFERCNDKLPKGYYSSSHKPFRVSKGTFRKFILQNYDNKDYEDSGFLNLRFLINCKGEIGDMEVNTLDENLLQSNLNKNMVDQLIELTVLKKNWQAPVSEEPRDAYMYLIYKIKNGEISEILP